MISLYIPTPGVPKKLPTCLRVIVGGVIDEGEASKVRKVAYKRCLEQRLGSSEFSKQSLVFLGSSLIRLKKLLNDKQ